MSARFRELLAGMLRHGAFLGWTAEHFEGDSRNLAGMFFDNSVVSLSLFDGTRTQRLLPFIHKFQHHILECYSWQKILQVPSIRPWTIVHRMRINQSRHSLHLLQPLITSYCNQRHWVALALPCSVTVFDPTHMRHNGEQMTPSLFLTVNRNG